MTLVNTRVTLPPRGGYCMTWNAPICSLLPLQKMLHGTVGMANGHNRFLSTEQGRSWPCSRTTAWSCCTFYHENSVQEPPLGPAALFTMKIVSKNHTLVPRQNIADPWGWGCIGGGGGVPHPPLEGAQPMSRHCPPDGKRRSQWRL